MLKSYFRSNFGIIVLITLISLSQAFSLTSVEKIKNTYSAVSIRLSQPIQTERISRIRDNSAREMTFWFQCEDMNISAGFGRITAADCIFYNGNGRNVYPAVFSHGGYPSAISDGCAISEKLSSFSGLKIPWAEPLQSVKKNTLSAVFSKANRLF